MLVWIKRDKKVSVMDEPWRYVVYCFEKGEKINLENSKNIVAITSSTYYRIPANESGKRTYVVTVLDRVQNESKGVKCKVKK